MLHPARFFGTFVLLFALGAAGFAHEDDPKLLDRHGPYSGPGFRRTNLTQPNQLALGGSTFASDAVSLFSWIPLSEMGSPQSGSDCWGYTSPSGREYALMGHYEGTTFVDLSVPSNATVIATLAGPNSLWRDVKVYGDHAYSVSEGGGGIQIFSLAQIDDGIVSEVGSVTSGGTTKTHNVAINEESGFLYRFGGDNNGMRIYDLNANPVNPPLVATWSTRYIHDAQVVSYTSGPYAGKEVVFACSGYNGGGTATGLDVIDVTNKSSLSVMANVFYSNAAYSHQGWLSPDYNYFYLGDELDENGTLPTTTHIFDVSNLNSPLAVSSFTNGNQAVGHNLYTKGDLIYEANYRSGLRIFDATNPLAPVETAYFDTYPENDLDGFNGLWSVYPYFESGFVIGSDLERGLFVLWPGDVPLTIDLPLGAPALIDPAGATLAVSISELVPGALAAGSEQLHVYDGQGWSTSPLANLGGGSWQASFPASACGTTLQYYVSADDSSGVTWTSPEGAPFALYSSAVAVGQATLASDELETASGWTAGSAGDDATTGVWTRVDPNATAAQPEDDHTPSGTLCFVTGQGTPGGSNGENDVDGGTTTLVTPAYDLSSSNSPSLSYWRWFSNDTGSAPSQDVFVIEISNDGTNWVNVETVGPNDGQSSGGWFQNSVLVESHVALTNNVQLRFRASDLGSGSIVEAAIDDLVLSDVDCGSGCAATNYCSSAPNSAGAGALMSASGSTSVAANDLVLHVSGATPSQPGLLYYGSTQISAPFGDGLRCVGGGTFRLNPALISDGVGASTRAVDYSLPPADAGPGRIQAGDTWYFQFWYRDPAAGGSGFNLSDGLSVVFCP